MRAAILLVGLAALAIPWSPAFASDPDVRAANRAWLTAPLGDAWDPDEVVRVATPAGVDELPAGVALDLALDATGDRVRLADLAGAASHGGFPVAGDVWIVESWFCGFFCPVPFAGPTCPTFETILDRPDRQGAIPADPQAWVYGGDAVLVAEDEIAAFDDFGFFFEEFVTGWTTKDVVRDYNRAIAYQGAGFFLCVEGFAFAFNFAFFDGEAGPCGPLGPVPPVHVPPVNPPPCRPRP